MEFLIAALVICLAALGLAVGLVFTGRPLKTSCEGAACLGGARCEGCPRRVAEDQNHA